MELSQETFNAVLITVAIMSIVCAVVALIVRRVSRRKFGRVNATSEAKEPSKCNGNCGCQCSPPRTPGCVPALECTQPYAHPIAIHGLSCNPADPIFAYAGDVQTFVDATNKRREAERQAQSLQRLKDTMQWIETQNV